MSDEGKKLSNLSPHFTDCQLADIVLFRARGDTWPQVASNFNKKHKGFVSEDTVRKLYEKYGNFFETDDNTTRVKALQALQRTKKSSALLSRENKSVVDYLNAREDLVSEIKKLVEELKTAPKIDVQKMKPSKAKKNMTMELLVSDWHIGQKGKAFSVEIARRRVKEMTRTVMKEIERNRTLYNVERMIIAILGDMIASATMHGIESARGCSIGNSEQIVEATRLLFQEVILPIAMTGIKIDIACITGNHDRTEQRETFASPGAENATWVIYNMLADITAARGLKNVTFHIPAGSYLTLEIYGNSVLYEHGQQIGSLNREAAEKLFNKRQTQLGKILQFYRFGHFHETCAFGRGRIIANASLPGVDSFADILGYASEASQTLNYYVETEARPTCFYRSFPIYLERA